MSHGKHAYYVLAMLVGKIPVAIIYGGREAFVAEHYTLRGAGGAGSIIDNGKVFGIVGRIVHVLGSETFGIFFIKEFV
jgi:hypothetical protein